MPRAATSDTESPVPKGRPGRGVTGPRPRGAVQVQPVVQAHRLPREEGRGPRDGHPENRRARTCFGGDGGALQECPPAAA